MYDLGVAEIALTLGCAEGTVKAHRFRGRAALAARLDRAPGGESMTIEDLGRSAADAARRKAVQEVDPAMMLQRLHRSSTTRTVLTAAAVVVALGGGGRGRLRTSRGTRASSSPAAGPTACRRPSRARACTAPGVTCLGADRFRTDLVVPVTLTAP